nr:cysteine desulfurase [Bacteroidota bacterium]
MGFDIQNVRGNFPILRRKVYEKQLVYLDNAATTQKPDMVIDRLNNFYSYENSNVHRGIHHLSQEATACFEEARDYVQKFLNAHSRNEIIFTRGTTESINLVAQSFGRKFINPGDEVLISQMEHHSNIVPWQMICEERGARLLVVPITESAELNMKAFEKMLSDKTRIVAITHVSNTLGTINPVDIIVKLAHRVGARVLIDGAQAIAHLPIDLQNLDCDFYCFSGHKVYGPTGIGVLYGKVELLEEMLPYQCGGEMISEVTFEKTTFNELPYKFEAGTPNIAGALGLHSALLYLDRLGIRQAAAHEDEVFKYALDKLGQIDQIIIYSRAQHKTTSLSFNLKGVHPYDVGSIIDKFAVAVRTGHLCTQPLTRIFQVPGFVRASFAVYNTTEEVDIFINAVIQAKSMLMS